MAMSVFHRVTGVVLYGGITFLALLLAATASGPEYFEMARSIFDSLLGTAAAIGFTWVLMHHMLGGVRHLIWDFGYGMEPLQRVRLARFTLVGSVSLTGLIWIVVYLIWRFHG
jgi:succinate dehydrogenase / fumarate reductase cytochrome b subunit